MTEQEIAALRAGMAQDRCRHIVQIAIGVIGFLSGIMAIGVIVGTMLAEPQVPACPSRDAVIIGSGEWDAESGRWSEYLCVYPTEERPSE